MAGHDGLVDLSLFATSPADDRHFNVDNEPAIPSRERQRPQFSTSRQPGYPLPRSYTMKPLPPLPRRRLCKTRGSSNRPDFSSRCILTRMRRHRVDDHVFGRACTLQQRRNGNTSEMPQLTLTLPQSSREPPARSASAMIWMPDEQMWLIGDELARRAYTDHTDYISANAENMSYSSRPNYPRSEPSPGPYTYYDLTPPDSPESPVVNQFRSLLVEPRERRDEERLSPMFQEAIQTVPMSETRSLSPSPSYRSEQNTSEYSRQGSFHSAIEFLAGGPTRPIRQEQKTWDGLARRVARSNSALS